MLLALQTTAEGIDESTFDALTLALLVGFVVSMVALSFLLARRGGDPRDEREPPPESSEQKAPPPTPHVEPRVEMRTVATPLPSTPAWLTGATFPQTSTGLSEATAVIEQLLEARRNRTLAAGVAHYSPAFRARLATELGVAAEDLEAVLDGVTIEGDAPVMRSVELLSAPGGELQIRVGYADRTSELYRLVRVDGRWAIDSIERT